MNKIAYFTLFMLVTLAILGYFFFYSGGSRTQSDPTKGQQTTAPSHSPTTVITPSPMTTATASTAPTTPTPDPLADAVSATQVVLKTSMGDIRLTLFPTETPLAVRNFVTLGKRGYYQGVVFHRIIAGFMNQAGDPTGTGAGGESIYGDTFKTELTSRPFKKGVLGVARTNALDTNGSQFFIMAADYPSLNGQYTPMGMVSDTASQAVVDAMNTVATTTGDRPITPVTITGFEIVQ
jgi:cyclophilin family peptidyl-prolyl cis-trans isomerase